MQDPRDRVHDEHVVGEDMLEFLRAFLEGMHDCPYECAVVACTHHMMICVLEMLAS